MGEWGRGNPRVRLLPDKDEDISSKREINNAIFKEISNNQCHTGTRYPTQIIFSNTRTRPKIFSEKCGIFGYRVFEKSEVFIAKIYKHKILSMWMLVCYNNII